MTASDLHTPARGVGPYAYAARDYRAAGWEGAIPVQNKWPPVKGYTGDDGLYPSGADVQAWIDGPEAWHNIALRLPDNVIGIDVDAYNDKGGDRTLADLEAKLVALPATWMSTSRTDGASGIRLYRVPVGLAWPGTAGPGIDIVRKAHRYVMCWPSVHPDGAGRVYRWTHPDPGVASVVNAGPTPANLPELPDAWIQHLTGGQAAVDRPRADLTDAKAVEWLAGYAQGEPCRAVRDVVARALTDLALVNGSRHETAAQATARVAHLAAEGHLGAAKAIMAIGDGFRAAVGKDPHRIADPGEYGRLVAGAARLAAGAGHTRQNWDPCDDPFGSKEGVLAELPATMRQPASFEGDDTPPGPVADDATLAAANYLIAVGQEQTRQRINRDARRMLDDEEHARHFREPDAWDNLTAYLDVPDEDVAYLIDQVLPVDANVLLVAQFKAGKTTTVLNLVRALVDAEPFLGAHKAAAGERVGFWNYEVSAGQMRRWFRGARIANTAAVAPLDLRGHTFPLVTQRGQDWAVRWLEDRQITTWVVDPFARAFVGSGDNENDNGQVGRFLDVLDNVKQRAGVHQLIMPTHTGRADQVEGRERARGATRLDDWADVRWLLTVGDEDRRYFRAIGRDVDVPECELSYDESIRALTVSGGSRKTRDKRSLEDEILDAIRDKFCSSANDIVRHTGRSRQPVLKAVAELTASHRVRKNDAGFYVVAPDGPFGPGGPS